MKKTIAQWSVGIAVLATLAGCSTSQEGPSKLAIEKAYWRTLDPYITRHSVDHPKVLLRRMMRRVVSEGCKPTSDKGVWKCTAYEDYGTSSHPSPGHYRVIRLIRTKTGWHLYRGRQGPA
ncbi:hypothetical protein HFU84_08605 [Acidithiobacillus sp. CV18-2]|nr:hypothetical protein [Acidithiobacillus sp. CV18-3]MBU2756952.1 hypothetical protein [Acidithiobacillus sp. BN09-2]MBU2777563.1 hypothetical protein [Acidithiobacillus sp. CV18-2]MBU2799663.1 hypothetical protein [Acidithiobacillus sp. VAN18-4]